MFISCKCLNFVGSSNISRNINSDSINQSDKNNQPNKHVSSALVDTISAVDKSTGGNGQDNMYRKALVKELLDGFLERYSKNFEFFSTCMELLKQDIESVADLLVTIHQRDLCCPIRCVSWIINICINCRTAVYAQHTKEAIFLINSNLLTINEELVHRKKDKCYSETFNILIMNHQNQQINDSPFHSKSNIPTQALQSLKQNLQLRLQKEFEDTEERIRRYSEQQFALLKSFREKSEQEYKILADLVYKVPEQIMIDAIGPPENVASVSTMTKSEICVPEVRETNSSASAMDNATQASTQNIFSFNNKKVTSLDTPPATPDSTPMSVGNSPTFNRQHQLTGMSITGTIGATMQRSPFEKGIFCVNSSSSMGGGMDGDNDCLFELDGVESYLTAPGTSLSLNISDVEECPEDAEDALAELEVSIPIPSGQAKNKNVNSFAKSLPITIANSVNDNPVIVDSDDDILDLNIDIAASIKALARSVHGDAIFGDLPRPRLGTQI